ncbi:MAG: tRNA pseudouridine(38-40) synthase TruA [Armatimonadetes bacterium]|nr:tRNA pseudouridine(38-40) synthase TruA [Armatimonadota bacterium]
MSGTKRRIKLVVAYDGTDFCGWAPQEGERTVQSTLSLAVSEVADEEIEVVGASRTDSGAHARGQVCHFDTGRPILPEKWVRAANDLLPPDVAVVRAQVVPSDFHSRFWAVDRWYRYKVRCGKRDPFSDRTSHWHGRALDVESMQLSALSLVGSHDFFAFTQLVPPGANTVRELFSVRVTKVSDEVRIDIVGTAFARGMMRRISGGLVEVGRGAREPGSIARLLVEGRSSPIHRPVVLPAKGLTLMRVRYGRHPREHVRSDEDGTAYGIGPSTVGHSATN